tara:strand:+ start:45 stop:1274 length:1230 start_codon:yes stop_codon:yes gene_type:complete
MSFILIGDEECDFLREEVKDFIIVQRNSNDRNDVLTKVDYSEITEEYNQLLNDIQDNEGCSFIAKDSLRINLKYYHGIFTVKRLGDVSSLKKMLLSSQKIIDEKIIPNLKVFGKKSYSVNSTKPANYLDLLNEKFLDENDKGIRNSIIKEARDLLEYFSSFNKNKIIPEINKLNKLYKDFHIYIDDQKFLEMQEFFDKANQAPVYINIEPPPIYYKKSKYKERYEDQLVRMEYLRKELIPLKLTSYDKDKGFYMKIPMMPIVQEKRKNGPEYAYGITVNGDKKYRFEFNLVRTDDLNLSSTDLKMNSKSDVPYNWSKIYLPADYSWTYFDERNDFKIASYSPSSGVIQYGYEDDFIAIHKKGSEDLIIYQKKDLEKANYSIILQERNTKFPSWVKYLLFLTLFGAGYAQ